MRPDAAEVRAALDAAGVTVTGVSDETLGVVVRAAAAGTESVLAVLQAHGFDMLVDLFATDRGEEIEVTYHLRSLEDLREIHVKTAVEYGGEAPSVWRIYPAALYPEREAAELLGMSFAGHPNPKRLLTTDEVEAPLLRRDTLIRSGEEVALP